MILVMIGDSDAMVRPQFVRTLVDAFEQDSGIVLHLDEVRSQNRKFYPFNYPTFESVAAEASNWRDGKTIGVLDEFSTRCTRGTTVRASARGVRMSLRSVELTSTSTTWATSVVRTI